MSQLYDWIFKVQSNYVKKLNNYPQNRKKTIILTSHQAEIIELLADYVIVIDEGEVVYKGDYQDFLQQVPHNQEFEAVIEGEVIHQELQCRIEKGKSYVKRNSIDELTALLVKHNLMSHLIKIEKLSPTVEETLDYFYSQRGGAHHEVI